MALTKHGEGNILPESEQQRVAAKAGMTEESRQALAQENDLANRLATEARNAEQAESTSDPDAPLPPGTQVTRGR